MSRVLIGQSYFQRFDPKLWAEGKPYPPLGSLYAAAIVREQGHEVALFDAMLAASTAEWETALRETRPRYALIYEDNFNYLSKMCLARMREAALEMVRAAKASRACVVLCGADASDHAGLYLDAGADYVLLGEGDAALPELLERLESGGTGAGLAGVAWRDAAGRPRQSERRVPLRDLDALPLPAWDLVDFERYRAAWARHGTFSLCMVTSRGCPYHCSWCAKPIWGQRYAVRSPEGVATEMRRLRELAAPEHVWFMDDILGLKPGWMARYADLVEKEDAIRVPFKCLSRADLLLRDGEVEALARAGCQTVWIGAESGSQKILDAMEKGTRVEQIEEATLRLRAAGIRVGYFVQFGYPGEQRADIDATLALVRRMVPEEIGMSVSYPLPGTPFYERVKDQLGQKQNWDDSSDMAMLYDGPFNTNFYRVLYDLLHREWYVRHHGRELWRGLAVGRRPPLRRLGGLLTYWLSLPLLRLRLARLERQPHTPIEPVLPVLSPLAAGTPSAQGAAGSEKGA